MEDLNEANRILSDYVVHDDCGQIDIGNMFFAARTYKDALEEVTKKLQHFQGVIDISMKRDPHSMRAQAECNYTCIECGREMADNVGFQIYMCKLCRVNTRQHLKLE